MKPLKLNLIFSMIDVLIFIIILSIYEYKVDLPTIIIRLFFVALPLYSVTYSLKSFFKLKEANLLLISYCTSYFIDIFFLIAIMKSQMSLFNKLLFCLFNKDFFLYLSLPYIISSIIVLVYLKFSHKWKLMIDSVFW
jgi:hypothetical protein